MALWSVAALAPLAVLASALPVALAWALAPLCFVLGARSALAYAQQAPVRLQFDPAGGLPGVDGVPLSDLRIRWRSALAFAEWTADARRQRLVFWPDVLDAAARRELRLAMRQREAASRRTLVAR